MKIIDKKKSREDSYVRKNLRREGKILQMIRHSNIVQLLEIMETQNSYYLVTELCRGGDLMDYISQRRRLPEQEVKRYIRQIVSAVDYLHRLGILHRYSKHPAVADSEGVQGVRSNPHPRPQFFLNVP